MGRHIGDFAHSLVRPQLFDEIAAVRDGGPPVEDEVRDTDGRIYFLRILPHRTARARA